MFFLQPYFKPIPIRPQREFLPEPLQLLVIQGAVQHRLLVGLGLGDDLTSGVDDLRLAAVVQPMGILAHTVHAHPISLVLDGAGLQQCVPNVHP